MKAAALVIILAACSNAASPTPDAPPHHGDAPASTDGPDPVADAPAALRILVINEVVAAGSPDWFEVVNATPNPIQLADFKFADANDTTKAVAFPAMTLAAGAYFAQDVDGTVVPFKLGSDEELWVFRASDNAVSDTVDWAEGDSPMDGSYARNPDIFGAFATSTTPTRGAPNQ